MKNTVAFFLALALPLVLLAALNWGKSISSPLFFWLMGAYCFIYHPVICGLRLIARRRLSRNKFWMCFIPFFNWKYSNDAVFGAGK